MTQPCANPTCDRQARTNPHDYRGKYCTVLCSRTARHDNHKHLSDVAIPMALYYRVMAAAADDMMSVDEWIVYAIHDAVS